MPRRQDDDAIYMPVSPIVVQRDMAFGAYSTAVEALRDSAFTFPVDEPAMLVSRRGHVSRLNLTAAFLWDALDGTRSARDLAVLLGHVLAIGPEEARAAVHAFLTGMQEQELVVCGAAVAPIS
jgi:hypothetical protein